MRRGLGAGQGSGYKNIIGIDPLIHRQSAMGMKQPQKSRTWQQHERQSDHHREHGKYAKMNPCEICGKSAGADYCSFPDTNSTGYGLVICDRCAKRTWKAGITTSVQAKEAGLFDKKPEPMEHDDGMFDVFMKDVDFKNATKEASYDEVDGQVQKQHGTSTRAVFGTVVDEFKAKTINTIHNHPSENPPSMNDIFSFLYSGRHHEDRVVLPSGTVYIMERKPETEQLSHIHRQISPEQGSDPIYINALNHDKRSAQQRFARFYNELTRIEVLNLKSQGLDSDTIRFQKSPEIQDKVLRRLGKIYNFEVRTELLTQ